MKTVEQYFLVVVVVVAFESVVDAILMRYHSFPTVLFIMLYKVALTFESVNEILVCLRCGKILNSTFLWYCSLC